MKNPNEYYSQEEREEMADELRDRTPAEGSEPWIRLNHATMSRLTDENASLREQLAQAQLEVEALKGNVKELRKALARSTGTKERGESQ